MRELYEDLHRIARREFSRAGAPMTLQATALIGEAYVKLQSRAEWENRNHFLGSAATAMRHILVDAARARQSQKRGGDFAFTSSLDSLAAESKDSEVIKLGEALIGLAAMDKNLAKVIDCRFFAGMTEQETAEIIGVSDRTVRRWWVQARAWVYREMEES